MQWSIGAAGILAVQDVERMCIFGQDTHRRAYLPSFFNRAQGRPDRGVVGRQDSRARKPRRIDTTGWRICAVVQSAGGRVSVGESTCPPGQSGRKRYGSNVTQEKGRHQHTGQRCRGVQRCPVVCDESLSSWYWWPRKSGFGGGFPKRRSQ